MNVSITHASEPAILLNPSLNLRNSSSPLTSTNISSSVDALSDADWQNLFMDDPLKFGYALIAQDKHVKIEIMKALTSQIDDWQGGLIKVFIQIRQDYEEKELAVYPDVTQIYWKCIEGLNSKQKSEFIEFCGKELPIACLALLLVTLNKRFTDLALNRFKEKYPLTATQFEGGFQVLIDAISEQIPFNEAPSFWFHLYDHYLEEFDFVKNFLVVSFQSRLCLLASMPAKAQKEIYIYYCNHLSRLASWLTGLFPFKSKFEEKRQLFDAIYFSIKENKIDDFIKKLNERKSPLIPFMLLHIEEAQKLMFYEAQLCTELLSYYTFESATPELVKELNSTEVIREFIFEMMPLDLEVKNLSVENMSLKNYFVHLESMSEQEEIETRYSDSIAKIPPLLIGLAGHRPDYQMILLKLVFHLTDEQLKFLVLSFPPEETYQIVESLTGKLRPKQFQVCLMAFSDTQIENYMSYKLEALELSYQNFRRRLSKLSKNLQEIDHKASIKVKTYQHYKDEAVSLSGLFRQNLSSHLQELVFFIRENKHRQIVNDKGSQIEKNLKNFESKKPLFEGALSVFYKLDKVKGILEKSGVLEEEYDPFSAIYEGFWNCFKGEEAHYLDIGPTSSIGVQNPAEISLIGIRTDADLEFLSISKKQQIFLDKQSKEIQAVFLNLIAYKTNFLKQMNEEEENFIEKTTKDLSVEWNKRWNKLWTLKTESSEIEGCVDQIIEFLDLYNQNLPQLIQVCQRIIQNLLLIKDLTNDECQNLNHLLLNSNQPINSNSVDSCKNLLKYSLLMIQKKQTLSGLKRYCQQGSALKNAWKNWRDQGYNSIESVMKNKFLSTKEDLFKLDKLPQKRKRSVM